MDFKIWTTVARIFSLLFAQITRGLLENDPNTAKTLFRQQTVLLLYSPLPTIGTNTNSFTRS